MPYQDYSPTSWTQNRRPGQLPLATPRQEMDSLFDDFGNGVFQGVVNLNIRSNVSETDKEIAVNHAN